MNVHHHTNPGSPGLRQQLLLHAQDSAVTLVAVAVHSGRKLVQRADGKLKAQVPWLRVFVEGVGIVGSLPQGPTVRLSDRDDLCRCYGSARESSMGSTKTIYVQEPDDRAAACPAKADVIDARARGRSAP